MMVKEVIVPSGSVPPNPGTGAFLSGNKITPESLATGGWLTGGVGGGVGVGGSTGVCLTVVVTVALGWEPLLLLLLGSGVVDRLWEVFVMPIAGTIKVT